MRKILLAGAAICGLVGFVGSVRAENEAQAIIDKAVKAHGGLEKLTKLKAAAAESKAKGHVYQPVDIDITMEIFAQDKKFKHIVRGEVMGIKFTQTLVFNGEKLWIDVNGQEVKLDEKKYVPEIKEQMWAESVIGLTFMKKGGYELSVLGEVKVQDRPAVGVRVSAKGHRDVNLFFDKEKGLLVKTETRAIDFQSDQETTEEKILRDYKDMGGFLQPTKVLVTHDGKKHVDLEIEEVKIVDKFDDSVFAKP
jgi:hypothetical protein